MSYTAQKSISDLKNEIINSINKAIANGDLVQTDIPAFILERPADRKNGDIATNVAMACAKSFRLPPFKIAQIIIDNIDLSNTYAKKVEMAGPGFINFFLSSNYYADILNEIFEKGDNYGNSDYGKGKKVMVEFVSANPTGPMHMGNARGGALGDCLASVLEKVGYDVWREFYVNDAGNQIEKFGVSLEARYLQIFKGVDAVAFPEDGYQGSDILDRATQYADKFGDKLLDVDSETRKQALIDFALPLNIEKMKNDMAKYRIEYDKWFFESELHNSGAITETINILKENNMVYEKDGALWYKNIDIQTAKFLALGKTQEEIDKFELKDDVLIRQNGNPTYFAADIAYHRNKLLTRDFDLCIDVWGADHHGHVARIKGAMDSIGLNGDDLDVLLMQLVNLVRDGKPVKMSKRTGKSIQLADLLDEVSTDAARFLFNMREANTQMDFDLDLAVQQDSQNPVYYVQYAHARICSIINSLEENGTSRRACTNEELALLSSSEEIELINHLASYSDELIASANDYDPTKINKYLLQLASLFHKFYNSNRVRVEDEKLMQARLNLCFAVKNVIYNVLTMFKISTPESM